MSLRLGFGFWLSRHIYLGASVPLGHARSPCFGTTGTGDGNWFDTLLACS
jgi:hypothetical protein